MNHTIELSPEVYRLLQQKATALHATLEAVVESAVRLQYSPKSSIGSTSAENQAPHGSNTTVDLEALPAELDDELAQLAFLSDSELWQAALSQLSTDDHDRMESLLHKQQATGLELDELAEAEALADRYDRTMLIRAKAAVLLKDRGVDITDLGPITS